MIYRIIGRACILATLIIFIYACSNRTGDQKWTINDKEYLEEPGLSVLVFHDFYPNGKQGGIEIIQHGERIASNGFIRLERVDGRGLEEPERAVRTVDRKSQVITARVSYPDMDFNYSVRIWPEGDHIRLSVDLEKPIPASWENKLQFGMEFYPPLYFGKSYQLDTCFGIIARQGMGSLVKNEEGRMQSKPMASGKVLTLAGEDPLRKVVIEGTKGDLTLTDERNYADRGWIVVSSPIPAGVTASAIEWTIKPNVIPGWKREPMIAYSQVGYHPDQVKQAIIELDPNEATIGKASLLKISGTGDPNEVFSGTPKKWGKFLCYNYAVFDFSQVKDPGMYEVKYADQVSNPFAIGRNVYKNDVWQPTLEGYFPVQMCHVLVRDRQAIWHGACHLDDALQAPLDCVHVDGYRQYKLAETPYAPQTPVPFLNQGGWHDAGDDDLAAGSQAATTQYLVLASEISNDQPDQTSVNFEKRFVQMYQPDGIPDFAQQIKQGALNLLSGYRAAGHSFIGIIANREGRNITGDWASQTDQLFYDSKMKPGQKTLTHSGINDDRWVFTNRDTGLEYQVMAALAAASRSLKGYDDKLAGECLETAEKAWNFEQNHEPVSRPDSYVPHNQKAEEVKAAAELLFTTKDVKYASALVSLFPSIRDNIWQTGWCVARVSDQIKDDEFQAKFRNALQTYKIKLDSVLATNPFGVPWEPRIWGIGWDIQDFALEHFYLVKKYPDLFDKEIVFRVVNYVLGCHPGSNTSLVSGVGARSVTSAFSVYRHLWYYIPGGMVSGTALIRPDFPELREPYPYLWQQTEYVMPGAASYIFCVLATEDLLNVK